MSSLLNADAKAEQDRLKRAAAEAAVTLVEDGMVVGLGTGSTAAFALEALAARIAKGLRVSGVPTSEATAALARRLGVPLTDFAAHRRLDLAIDGADEVERGTLNLIKGLGGALLYEKIVAAASRRFVVIADATKLVDRLGERAPLPVEIVPFGLEPTLDRLADAGLAPLLRRIAGSGEPFRTDGGHAIADCRTGPIANPAALDRQLRAMVGVVDSGLFIGMAAEAFVGTAQGVQCLTPQ
ncbi:ribose-5-phosphate isomerase RpiA [Azospirillum rugosum]|uniref:Ribose-5-phosphate isomerase A n=1 Tax=Azospirillum rugosum TaxID=416170 RepID=A0ABS4SV51_9PROT|nr:ribose-5-phosphate isomerase RpiA [Azospirillum rugosum]MBP2296439.1 ribose 5-phosphate isomerase A [Azospirillum rugosum]MDQ0529960.1 ribose 5-phosphate isomerase A [Azospirillum rugosum]